MKNTKIAIQSKLAELKSNAASAVLSRLPARMRDKLLGQEGISHSLEVLLWALVGVVIVGAVSGAIYLMVNNDILPAFTKAVKDIFKFSA